MWNVMLATASEEWGGDEMLLLVVCGVATVLGVVRWGRWLAAVPKLGVGPSLRTPLVGTLLVSLGAIWAVAWYWAAEEIRRGQPYVWLVMAMGGACLMLCSAMLRWLGVSVRDDACERRNPAAAIVVCGALMAETCLYCGSITGEGPSFWNNVFSVVLGTGGWVALWMGLAATSQVTHAVSEDRDVASGLRLGALLLAQGLVLGRALAGNWVSVAATTQDFVRDGWPSIVLLAMAILAEHALRPTPANPSPWWVTRGLPAAGMYLVIALGWVFRLGWWEGAPQ